MKFKLLEKEYEGISIGETCCYGQAHQYWVLSPKDKADLQSYGKTLVFDQGQKTLSILNKPVSVEIQKSFNGDSPGASFFPSEVLENDFDKINALIEYLDGIYWMKESHKVIQEKKLDSKEAAEATLTTVKQFWGNIKKLMKEEN